MLAFLLLSYTIIAHNVCHALQYKGIMLLAIEMMTDEKDEVSVRATTGQKTTKMTRALWAGHDVKIWCKTWIWKPGAITDFVNGRSASTLSIMKDPEHRPTIRAGNSNFSGHLNICANVCRIDKHKDFSAATFSTQTKQRATPVAADDIKRTLDPSRSEDVRIGTPVGRYRMAAPPVAFPRS
ncbi:hypothetical protein KCU95_g16372, partial [Aureobasidium melanogenum]